MRQQLIDTAVDARKRCQLPIYRQDRACTRNVAFAGCGKAGQFDLAKREALGVDIVVDTGRAEITVNQKVSGEVAGSEVLTKDVRFQEVQVGVKCVEVVASEVHHALGREGNGI